MICHSVRNGSPVARCLLEGIGDNMTVKELIYYLNKFDGNLEVLVSSYVGNRKLDGTEVVISGCSMCPKHKRLKIPGFVNNCC